MSCCSARNEHSANVPQISDSQDTLVFLQSFCLASKKFSFQLWQNKNLPSQQLISWTFYTAVLLSEWWKDLSMPDIAECLSPGSGWMKGCEANTVNYAKTMGLKPALWVGTSAHKNSCFLKVIYFTQHASYSPVAHSFGFTELGWGFHSNNKAMNTVICLNPNYY